MVRASNAHPTYGTSRRNATIEPKRSAAPLRRTMPGVLDPPGAGWAQLALNLE
jgi:hypothetical protein